MRRVATASAGLGAVLGFELWRQDEAFYQRVAMPLVQRVLDGEDAHVLGVWAAKHRLWPRSRHSAAPSLRVRLLGLEFGNCVGMAAGFDKNGECIEGVARMGFGAVEVGSVTPLPQPGNERPRVFRLAEDQAVINRYGFNSEGHAAVQRNIAHYRAEQGTTPVVLGINLGKNKTSESAVADYSQGVRAFASQADYLVVNISSPNTPGLRNLQAKKELDALIAGVLAARDEAAALSGGKKTPLLLKIAPDLTEQDKADIAAVVLDRKVDGLIVSNTTVSRPASLRGAAKGETGGLSGQPLKDLATRAVFDMYKATKGQVPIIGVGGIASGQDAYEKLRAGASLVQVYSALTYYGPPLAAKIQRELEEILKKEGFDSVQQVTGAAHRAAATANT